jgi:aspartyl-tRNA(Asn)/glutamyl-tRNA(Gln) amidotransferase subunit C
MDLHEGMPLAALKETAQLAHLNLGKDELSAALPAFEQMLGFFAAMQGADDDTAFNNAAVQGLSAGQAAGARLVGADHFRGTTNGKDGNPGAAPDKNADAELNEKILTNAGERDGRFIVIPNVL